MKRSDSTVTQKIKKYPAADSLAAACRFGLVGLLNTGVDALVFFLLTEAGLSALPAHVCSYIAGLTNSFFWNKFWTFRRPGSFSVGETVRFIVVNLAALSAAGAVLLAGRDLLGWPPLLAKAAALPFSLIVNFLGNRLWVFPARGSRDKETHAIS